MVGGAAVAGCLVLFLVLSLRPTPAASLVFIGFTNDVDGIRSMRYRQPDTRDRSLAVFHLTNHTDQRLQYFEGPIEHHLPTGWKFDTNELFVGMTSAKALAGHEQQIVLAPRPVGPVPWRFHVQLTGSPPSPPSWVLRANSILSRVGLSIPGKDWVILTVTSEPVTEP